MKLSTVGPVSLAECAPVASPVVVVGGGMAGSWVAYRLAKRGVGTILLTYSEAERGGIQGSSRRSAGALNVAPLSEAGLEAYLQQMGRGQTHPAVAPALRTYLGAALEELRSLVPLKPIRLGYALETGGGEGLLRTLQDRFRALGGTVVEGWATRLIADWDGCRGVQYEGREGIGKIRCRAMVLAAGGYSGLFRHAIRTHCFGNVLGLYLERGGWATNLEFLFKHGYGNVDANALTPTEELPGSEIYDRGNARVGWLEESLFRRQGTRTHLQAVQHWLRDPANEYYLDLSYRPLYLKLWELHATTAGELGNAHGGSEATERALDEAVSLFPEGTRAAAEGKLKAWIGERGALEYAMFEALKPMLELQALTRFRVSPLTYFSMGGIGHRDFATNLRNVFVTGEAMHDFGANRVGGLPWSLYLASGCSVAERVERALDASGNGEASDGEDFEAVRKPSRFDAELLASVQQRLHECQELDLTASGAEAAIAWFRERRRTLREDDTCLHDGMAWLLVAEAIMVSSLLRAESRGFFCRSDYREEDRRLDGLLSCARYDEATDTVAARLVPIEEFAGAPTPGVNGTNGSRTDLIHGALV